MNNLPDEIIFLIVSFLNSNDSLILVKTCKYYKEKLYNYGFYKSITLIFTHSRNDISYPTITDFIYKFRQHNRTIINLNLYNVPYFNNLPDINFCSNIKLPKRVKLSNYNCSFNINPTIVTNTENLYITTYKNKNQIKINWIKFPKLKYLYLHIYDLDFLAIELCSNLEVVFIYLELTNISERKMIPKNIGLLKNLRHIFTNCNLSTNTNFISEKLETCISNNKQEEIYYNSKNKIIKNRNHYNESSLDILYNNLLT